MKQIIIILINNKMQVLWNSKVKFVSVSQLLGLALWSLSASVTVPGLIGSLGGVAGDGGERGKKRPPADFKLAKRLLLVFLNATGRRGWASLFHPSCGFVRMWARSGPQSSQLPSLQSRSSMCCWAPTVHLCQAGAFHPPAVLPVGCTD